MQPIQCEERTDVQPRCTHCEKEILTVWFRKLEGLFGKRYIYFCASCQGTLGVSHRKGFWMG